MLARYIINRFFVHFELYNKRVAFASPRYIINTVNVHFDYIISEGLCSLAIL